MTIKMKTIARKPLMIKIIKLHLKNSDNLILHCLKSVYCKNIFNTPKIFIWRLLMMVSNQTECSSIEQSSFLKYLVASRYKPWEIYRKMCDLYREACFSQNILTNGLNMGLPLQTEQRSFIKYLLAEKCKPCEIYRRMYDLYREESFS